MSRRGFVGAIRVASGAILLGLVFAPRTAWAEERINVINPGCVDFDSEKFATLLATELELQTGSAAIAGMTVEIQCSGQEVQITIDDKLTKKKLTRAVPNPKLNPSGHERELALVASQLHLASWLDLARSNHSPKKNVPKKESVSPNRETRETGDKQPAVEIEQTADSFTGRVSLLGGVRYRPLSPALASFFAAARGGGFVGERLGVFGSLAFEAGRIDHAIGRVNALLGLAGFGLAFRKVFNPRFSLELLPTASIGYANLKGAMANDSVRMGAIGGLTGEFTLFMSPLFHLKRVVLSPGLMVGYMTDNPVGRVRADQTDRLSFGGLILGFSLEIGIAL